MLITCNVFHSYIKCKYKTYRQLHSKEREETITEYENLQTELQKGYKAQIIKIITTNNSFYDKEFSLGKYEDLKTGKKILINASFETDELSSDYLILEKVAGKSKLGSFHYTPIFVCKNDKITKVEKLLFTFNTLILGQIQGKIPVYVKIFNGEKYKASKLQTEIYLPEVKNIITEIKTLAESNIEPKFLVNDYCRKCSFCNSRALEKDDLSLLRGMSVKDIQKWNNKGIFTVDQLSYTFRPRKRNRRMMRYKGKHLFELKALAIREKKIFVYEKPTLPKKEDHVQSYLDIEGNENNTFHYLIGLVVVENGQEQHYSFWANDQTEEESIIDQFFNICSKYENYQIFHYGSYERRWLQNLKKKFPKKFDKNIDILLTHTTNVLSFIYVNIYFPTYTNELKDIGNYLGFKWSDENASGLQSIVWRTRWEMTQNDEFKQKLITYNLEDCLALKQTTELMYKISNNNNKLVSQNSDQPEFIWTQDFQSETSYNWGKSRFFFPNFEVINKCAYFDYQRDKIFIRTNKSIKKIQRKTTKNRKINFKANQTIIIRKPYKCYKCNSINIVKERESNTKKVIDLKFTQYGVKRWILEYRTLRYRCRECGGINTPRAFKQIKKYGHNFASWVVYHMIENGTSEDRMVRNISDIFRVHLAKSSLHEFKIYAAEYYRFTYKMILRRLITGKMLHSDETQVKLTTKEGYVWILTNMEVVIFIYKNSRESEFLNELLKDFYGVLISDFFAGYDSFECPQQKCLIHLIRDLNHDLFKNPFDEEFKEMVESFGILLRKIIDTIGKYGLKMRHLNKHKKDVKGFYSFLQKRKYISILADKYKKRFLKNKDKLFTFLNYDGVPWNNNNAEHAIKHFAVYRRKVDGLFTEKGINEYLVLLSIYQTCKYKNINFLQFLLSGKKTID